MDPREWQEELDFIRRWRGDDPWGRVRRRAEQGAASPASVSLDPTAMGGRPPAAADGLRDRLDLDLDREARPGRPFVLFDEEQDRSIRTAFPRATIELPAGEYCRLVHPLGEGRLRDPELSRLPASGLFFDLETLGFHGRPLFLIGMLHPTRRNALAAGEAGTAVGSGEAPAWQVVQLLARDYAEEEAILRAFAGIAGEQEPWVSFNGKAFDLPFLRQRARFHRVVLPVPREHRDLLHSARRLYRGVLPNCRLQTLEAALFSRYRYRDLPSGEIPAAYHEYVRTGDEEDMVRILRHNRDDLVTLARLHVHLRDDAKGP